MLNDENTPELEQEANEIQEEVEETVEETEETTDNQSSNEETDWKAEALKWKAIANRKAKQATKPEPSKQIINTSLSREEAVLIAEGMKVEDLEQLNLIAKAKKISLSEAKTDNLFVAYYDKVTQDRKAEKARLSASRGSAQKGKEATFNAPMSTEDHKKLWEEKFRK